MESTKSDGQFFFWLWNFQPEPFTELAPLDESALPSEPLSLFLRWFREAFSAEPFAQAAALATVSQDAQPSVRMVLVKGVRAPLAFLVVTGATSQKAQDLRANARCALLFFWATLYRQVIVQGYAREVARHEAQEYFRGRAPSHRRASWLFPQSTPIQGRYQLEERLARVGNRIQSDESEAPSWWTGYWIQAHRVEFWQGQPARLHDRIVYEYHAEARHWRCFRLAP